jgi:hypothetical protein
MLLLAVLVIISGIGHNNMNETFATVADWIKRVSQ